MTERHFNEGWNAGLADQWSPPIADGQKAREDYASGWRLARDERLLKLYGGDGEEAPTGGKS